MYNIYLPPELPALDELLDSIGITLDPISNTNEYLLMNCKLFTTGNLKNRITMTSDTIMVHTPLEYSIGRPDLVEQIGHAILVTGPDCMEIASAIADWYGGIIHELCADKIISWGTFNPERRRN